MAPEPAPDPLVPLIAALRAAGNDARAAKEKSYQKSCLVHWGVAFPDMDRIIRAQLKGLPAQTLLPLARRLWEQSEEQTPVWDCRIAAGRILRSPTIAPDALLWRMIVDWLPDLDGWAVADNLARAAGRCLLANPSRLDEVELWLQSDSLWIQRAALVFTLPWTRAGRDPGRMLGWMEGLADDSRWFIQKAIGWWLRELSKADPGRVAVFLDAHGGRLKPVARREATRYL